MRPSSRSTLACSPGRWSSRRSRRACSISTRTTQTTSCPTSSAEWRPQRKMRSTRQYQRWKWRGHTTHCADSPMATTSTASRDGFGRICRDADPRSRSVNALRAYTVIDRRIGIRTGSVGIPESGSAYVPVMRGPVRMVSAAASNCRTQRSSPLLAPAPYRASPPGTRGGKVLS